MMPRSLPKLRGIPTVDTHAWMDTPVSSRCRFGDDVWLLDIFVPGRAPGNKRVHWDWVLPKRARITSQQYSQLLHAAKQYLWSMTLYPPNGRRRWAPSTLYGNSSSLHVIVDWMAKEGLATFRDLTPQAVESLMSWLRARPGNKGRPSLSPAMVGNYLMVIQTMYLQRAKLDDAPAVDPLRGETPIEAAGITAATGGSIPYIPDAVAIDLLSKALTWVEIHSTDILIAIELREREVASALARGMSRDSARHAGTRVLRRAAMTGPDGRSFVQSRNLQQCVTHLSTACFVVIAGFVGMRISEILSMRAGTAIEYHPIGETGLKQAYVAARLFKGSDNPKGTPELWAAPEPVVRAIRCLERLGVLLKKDTDENELFVPIRVLPTCIGPVTDGAIICRLRAFAQDIGVPMHEGKVWPLSSHQFRKTFARFVARGDRSNLLALAKHFKHISVAMTSRGYVGTDFELHQLVDAETKAETAVALDRILSSQALGGRMGERIIARNHAFRGRAGDQVRRDYIRFVLEETDLRVHACDYGWCVFQAETAQCKGEKMPNETRRGPSLCSGCANFTVDERHAPYWQNRRQRNLELLNQAGDRPLLRAVPEEIIRECDRVLQNLEEGHGVRRAEFSK